MKLGFLAADVSAIAKAAQLGFNCIELDCAAFGDPRQAPLEESRLAEAVAAAGEHTVEISALAYYGLATCDPPAESELELVYGRVFDGAERLGVRVVASMSGFDGALDWEQNMQLFVRRFRALAARAEERGLRLALENWMGFWGQLPFKPRNMGGSPATWAAWFEQVPSASLGLEFDPSHLQWQGIDPVRALAEFADRVYSFHAKDVELLPERRYRYGVNGDTFRFRIPGYGEVDWVQLASLLVETGYEGGVAIEHEDEVFGYAGDGPPGARYDEGLVRGRDVLAPLIAPA
jgi:sugar phosphate isomerase/epimerase